MLRREAGSHGKDTRGIIRVHHDKVEVIDGKPDEAEAEHQRLLRLATPDAGAHQVPYRVIDIPAGRSRRRRASSTAKRVPTQQTYRELDLDVELHDVSGLPAFHQVPRRERQAADRRDAQRTLATTRWLVAILENHQQPDGSVRIPDALVPFVGTKILEPKK